MHGKRIICVRYFFHPAAAIAPHTDKWTSWHSSTDTLYRVRSDGPVGGIEHRP